MVNSFQVSNESWGFSKNAIPGPRFMTKDLKFGNTSYCTCAYINKKIVHAGIMLQNINIMGNRNT